MFDLPIWSLIVLVWALAEGWPPVVLMWVCWGQGLCFGLFISLRVLFAKQRALWGKHRRIRPASAAFGFISFYAFFHFFYAYFLVKLFEQVDFGHSYIRMILLPTGSFFLFHSFCMVYRIIKGEEAWVDQYFLDKALMRIIPMAVLIIGAGFLKTVVGLEMDATLTLMVLLALKTFADGGTFAFWIKGFLGK